MYQSYFFRFVFPLSPLTVAFYFFLLGVSVMLVSSASGNSPTSQKADPGEHVLIHHWNFNDIPNDSNFAVSTPEQMNRQLLNVSSRYYGAFLSYDGARWDRVNEPTSLNARESPYVEEDDRALRLRNPAGSMHLFLPTTGYRDMIFRYAVTRTSSGAHAHTVEYSIDGGLTYSEEGLSNNLVFVSEDNYGWVEFDFSDIPGVSDNPDFVVRITMTGENSEPDNDSGNQRFNNVTLDGTVMEPSLDRDLIHHWEFDNIPNPDDPEDGYWSFPTELFIRAGGIVGGHSTTSEDGRLRYDGARWDRVNAPTPFNARAVPYEEDDDRALRLRNPAGPFLLKLPTTGHSDVVFRYVVKRTSSGAHDQEVSYSLDGETFLTEGLRHPTVKVDENYILHELDFSHIPEVNDNPDFTIRISASGKGAEPDNEDGNQRYNHITVDAVSSLTSSQQDHDPIPGMVRLEQNYPNPFNPSTKIRFSLPEQRHVTLEVFDITGRHIQTLVDRVLSSGTHTERFNATGLAGGLYLYRLQTGNEVMTRRMMLIK